MDLSSFIFMHGRLIGLVIEPIFLFCLSLALKGSPSMLGMMILHKILYVMKLLFIMLRKPPAAGSIKEFTCAGPLLRIR